MFKTKSNGAETSCMHTYDEVKKLNKLSESSNVNFQEHVDSTVIVLMAMPFSMLQVCLLGSISSLHCHDNMPIDSTNICRQRGTTKYFVHNHKIPIN